MDDNKVRLFSRELFISNDQRSITIHTPSSPGPHVSDVINDVVGHWMRDKRKQNALIESDYERELITLTSHFKR